MPTASADSAASAASFAAASAAPALSPSARIASSGTATAWNEMVAARRPSMVR